MNTEITNRIKQVQQLLKQNGTAAVIIPQTDPHQSEYIASHWQVRRFLSGFTGSAGSLLILQDAAYLWTDSRYFIQAAQQLEGTPIALMKEGLPETPSISGFLTQTLAKGDKVGVDGWIFSVNECEALTAELAKAGIEVTTGFDFIDEIWNDRPDLPADKIFIHENVYAGEDAAQKMERVMAKVKADGADAIFISALDDIAWTLNIRSRDVNCNPVATAFLYLSDGKKILFTNPAKVDDTVAQYLGSRGVTTAPYDTVDTFLSAAGDSRVLIDPAKTAVRVKELLKNYKIGVSPVAMMKTIKNDVQIQGIRSAMHKDGAALTGAFREIEERVAAGVSTTELDVADILTKHRSRQALYFDESFETIAGYGPHGAIVHYSATEESSVAIGTDSLLLIDSGAQYLDGTTDITRTITLGEPTAEQKRHFTLVMKGHIALGTQMFPEGTRGDQLDALARQFLWNEGMSYLHGTGHGVGHFLNVHEGPQSIRLNHVNVALQPGMLTSNEPGLYIEGLHGIRCENLTLVVPAVSNSFGNFYKFETMTLFPFDLRLFDTSIMTAAEIDWVNNYHANVRQQLLPLLTDEADRRWLIDKTEKL
ncbi:MAG: aminopeptidase P family protein [Muribaculaceae bacterium]|nr:aminopeptidase P family protein [Muribaculaceae bacterium]